MKIKTALFLFFFHTAFTIPFETSVNQALTALQELRTLMPERLWVQEFSLLVDQEGLEKQIQKAMQHPRLDTTLSPSFSLARSKDYLLRTTLSGETIRMLDRYQEFEQSPFWRTPNQMDRLHWLEK